MREDVGVDSHVDFGSTDNKEKVLVSDLPVTPPNILRRIWGEISLVNKLQTLEANHQSHFKGILDQDEVNNTIYSYANTLRTMLVSFFTNQNYEAALKYRNEIAPSVMNSSTVASSFFGLQGFNNIGEFFGFYDLKKSYETLKGKTVPLQIMGYFLFKAISLPITVIINSVNCILTTLSNLIKLPFLLLFEVPNYLVSVRCAKLADKNEGTKWRWLAELFNVLNTLLRRGYDPVGSTYSAFHSFKKIASAEGKGFVSNVVGLIGAIASLMISFSLAVLFLHATLPQLAKHLPSIAQKIGDGIYNLLAEHSSFTTHACKTVIDSLSQIGYFGVMPHLQSVALAFWSVLNMTLGILSVKAFAINRINRVFNNAFSHIGAYTTDKIKNGVGSCFSCLFRKPKYQPLSEKNNNVADNESLHSGSTTNNRSTVSGTDPTTDFDIVSVGSGATQ